jgi:hypothetical protein
MTRLALAAAVVLGLVQFVGPSEAADVRMYVRHDVADYAAWRKVYDGFDAERIGLGVTAQSVYRSLDNPNGLARLQDQRSRQGIRVLAQSEKCDAECRGEGSVTDLVCDPDRQVSRAKE